MAKGGPLVKSEFKLVSYHDAVRISWVNLKPRLSNFSHE